MEYFEAGLLFVNPYFNPDTDLDSRKRTDTYDLSIRYYTSYSFCNEAVTTGVDFR